MAIVAHFCDLIAIGVRLRPEPSLVGRWSKAQDDEVGRYYATVGRYCTHQSTAQCR